MHADKIKKVLSEVCKVLVGKDEYVSKVLMAVLAGGHILIEDIPGVGKTTMALAFSKAMNLKTNRMQFTPDVLPSDITGFYMYDQENKKFVYHTGPILCNLFLADEINRTSPKTQSALLEVMEEQKITVDGNTIPVPPPFTVMATQNPIGSAGTQMLPESQLDRFLISLSIGYPDKEYEIQMIKDRSTENPLDKISPVIEGDEVFHMQQAVQQIYVHDMVYTYIADLSEKTRNHEMIEFGISPRGTLALCNMAKSSAFFAGRDYVIPDDVSSIFADVSRHRIVLHSKAKISKKTKDDILLEILKLIPKPEPRG